jgi:hypothetical protein
MPFEENPAFFKGRGAQVNTHNKFLKNKYVLQHPEGLDEALLENEATQFYHENAKKIVSESNSPDLSHMFSINPYQGCEHGCIYCYARNSHEYYGFSAGLDFERKIIVKHNAQNCSKNILISGDIYPLRLCFLAIPIVISP